MSSFLPVLAFALGVPAPASQPAPVGPAPTLAYVRLGENGTLEYQESRVAMVPAQITRNVIVNGKIQVVVETITRPVITLQMKSMDKSAFEIRDLDGKKVDDAVAKKTLKNGGIVLMAASSNFPDAAYLKPIKSETLVVVPKMNPGPAPSPAIVAPAIPPPKLPAP